MKLRFCSTQPTNPRHLGGCHLLILRMNSHKPTVMLQPFRCSPWFRFQSLRSSLIWGNITVGLKKRIKCMYSCTGQEACSLCACHSGWNDIWLLHAHFTFMLWFRCLSPKLGVSACRAVVIFGACRFIQQLVRWMVDSRSTFVVGCTVT